MFSVYFIQTAINEAANSWGLKCLRYEISMALGFLIFVLYMFIWFLKF
jgi:hypothetical protein